MKINQVKYKTLLFILLLFMVKGHYSWASQPNSYICNSHVRYSVKVDQNNYLVDYTFKDNYNVTQRFKFYYPIHLANRNIRRFGVTPKLLSASSFSRAQIRHIARYGFFMMKGNILRPDKNAIIRFYRPYCKPIAEEIDLSLNRYKKNTRRAKIEFAMKFVQDIPYGIPDTLNFGKLNNGLMTPPEILVRGWGDCDSKAVLFVCILSYLINPDDMIILNQTTHHTLTAIKGKPEKGQVYISFENTTYILAETAGPGRFMLGDDGSTFSPSAGYKIEKVNL